MAELFQNGNVELTWLSKHQVEKLQMDRIVNRLNEGNRPSEAPYHRTKESMPKLPLEEITTRLTAERPDEVKAIKMREGMMPVVKVSKMAELLVSKFKKNCDEPPPDFARKVVSMHIINYVCPNINHM